MKRHLRWPLLLLLAGCDARIANSDALWMLWLDPFLLVFFVFSFRKSDRLLRRFATPAMIERLAGSPSLRSVRALLILVAVLGLVLSLTDLEIGFTWKEVQRKGVDIVVALDVSDSMLVRDAGSEDDLSRLDRARREIRDLLAVLEGDRVALVAFAGTAFLECPLTLDYNAAEVFLSSMDTDLIPVKGTDLVSALRSSLQALEESPEGSRAILLITDGENHAEGLEDMVDGARDAGVRIFTIGIGDEQGAPIPEPSGGFRRDQNGEMVMSRLDQKTLQEMSLATGGRSVRSVSGDLDLEEIYRRGIKASLEDQEFASSRRQDWENRFQWVVGMAALLLMVEMLLPDRRLPRQVEVE